MIFGSKSPKVDVTEYSLSVHFGICIGPVDALTGIYVDEKPAFRGRVESPTVISIVAPDLFGGEKQQGGLMGNAVYMPGDSGQVVHPSLAARLGLTPDTCPGYRGVSSLWFVGDFDRSISSVNFNPTGAAIGYFGDLIPGVNAVNGSISTVLPFGFPAANPIARALGLGVRRETTIFTTKGFVWGTNNPNLPPVSVEVTRSPKGLNLDQAMIGAEANPVHVVYECLTDTEWGMGESPGLIDTASFNQASETMIAEQFGVSLMYSQQAPVETFVNEVIDHIQAALYVNPRTGLWTIKLLRADYDINTLQSFDESNSFIEDYKRATYGEITNEIVVTWTNPVTEEEETVSVQDLAGIVSQGGNVVSDNRQYLGVRNAALAGRLAIRDLRATATPLASCEAILNREGWDIVPGAVIKLSSVEHNFTDVVFRVLKANYGRIDSGAVSVTLVEDIFGLNFDNYYQPSTSQWQNPSRAPEDMNFVVPITLPAFLQPYLADEVPTAPDAILGLFAASTNPDTFDYDFALLNTAPDGSEFYDVAATRPTVARGALPVALASEPSSTLPSPETTAGEALFPGSLLMIQGADESQHEMVVIGPPNEDGTEWQLRRGAMDTVPRDWPAGTPFWVYSLATALDDDIFRPGGAVVDFKLLTRSSLGVLPEEDAGAYQYTITDRPYLPLRPADVKINGIGFGEVDAREEPSIIATWANRNRQTEVDQLLQWTAPGVTPEDGQTTLIEIRSFEGTLVNTISGLMGESYEFVDYDFLGLGIARVSFFGERGDLRSLQGHELIVRRVSGGWGYSWGFAWGGNS